MSRQQNQLYALIFLQPSHEEVRGVYSRCRHHEKLGIRAICELSAAIVAVDRRTIHHRHRTADLDATVSFDKILTASGREHTLDALKSRETGGASIPRTPDEPPERCERRPSHFDSESLRSCQTHVSILKHARGGNANPYEAVKSNPMPGSSCSVNRLLPNLGSRQISVNEYNAEADRKKNIT